jgi:integrase
LIEGCIDDDWPEGRTVQDIADELGMPKRTLAGYVQRHRLLREGLPATARDVRRRTHPNLEARPLTRTNFYNVVQNATRRAGLEPIRVHNLRGSAASMRLAAGVAPQIVADQLGDRVQTVMSRYVRSTEDAAMAALTNFSAFVDHGRQTLPLALPVPELPSGNSV